MTNPPSGQPRPEYVPVSGLAVASMVCGICGIFTLGISSLVGLFLGYRARRETRTGHRRGDGMAITGIVLGWIAAGFALLVIAGATAGVLMSRGIDGAGDIDNPQPSPALAEPEASPSYTVLVGSAPQVEDPAHSELETAVRYTALSAGGDHSCAVRVDGTLACWGASRDGQADAPSGTYTAVSVGRRHSCAIRTEGGLVCWGNNRDGRADAPVGSYTAVSAGNLLSCAIRTDGTPACWGPGISVSVDVEGSLPRGVGYTEVSVSYRGHLCALRSDGTVACFGYSEFGQADAPLGTYTAVSVGELHSCAISTEGGLACWGYNENGQTNAPEGTFAAVSAGSLHSCALRTDGRLACWGAGGDWDFGQADAPSGSYIAVSAGEVHSCAIRADGTLACWGYNQDGQTNPP